MQYLGRMLLLWLAVGTQALAQSLNVEAGATLRLSNGAFLTLTDTRLVTDGQLLADSSTVVVLGNGSDALSSIGGSNAPTFYNLAINKSSNGAEMSSGIAVAKQLIFLSGTLHLNGHDLTLSSPDASIAGESELNRVWGNSGEIVIALDMNAPNAAAPGNLGISITSSENMGTTTIRRGHAQQTSATGYGIYRYFSIEPTNNANLDATLVFSYFDSELGGIIENEMDLWRKPSGGEWQAQQAVLDEASNTLTKTGISAFSTWTSGSTVNNPLPVSLLFFRANCAARGVQLAWATAQEANSDYFLIERSTDGLTWAKVAIQAAQGNASETTHYSHTDESAEGTVYYRLIQYDLDGSFQVFPVIETTCTGNLEARIAAYPNPAQEVLYLQNPSEEVAYELYTLNGVLLKQGKAQANGTTPISLAQYPTGMYVLKVGKQAIRILKE